MKKLYTKNIILPFVLIIFLFINCDKKDVVILGDSIGYNGYWKGLFLTLDTANISYPGSTTHDWVTKFCTKRYYSQHTIIFLGGNDLAFNYSFRGIEMEYDLLLSSLRVYSDYIYCISVMTVNVDINSNWDYPSPRYWCIDLFTTMELNSRIRDLCKKYNNVYYIELNGILTNEYGLLEQYTIDGIHITSEAYEIIAEILWLKFINQ